MNRRSLFGVLVGVLLSPFAFGKSKRDLGKLCKAEEVPRGYQAPVELHMVDVRWVPIRSNGSPPWKSVEWSTLGESSDDRLGLLRKLSVKFPQRLWFYVAKTFRDWDGKWTLCIRQTIVFGLAKNLTKDEVREIMVHAYTLGRAYVGSDGPPCFVGGDGIIDSTVFLSSNIS